jgi:hypothetical protein
MMGFRRKEKEETQQTKACLSDLEIHVKYWEFVLSRFVQGVTKKAKKTLEKACDFADLELSQNLMKRLKNGFNGKNIH